MIVGLVRAYVVDWLARGDASVCEEILDPGYVLRIGAHEIAGRDAYVAATVDNLLEKWPHVGVTVHELTCSGNRAAVRLSEHGASARDGSLAAWGVVTLFESDGERLVGAWAEEDYAARRRQLTENTCDTVPPPAVAPWATADAGPSPAAEDVVRRWLAGGALDGVDVDDRHASTDRALPDGELTVDAMFSAGPRVAFHATRGGMALAGIVTAGEDHVTGGHVIRDRLGA